MKKKKQPVLSLSKAVHKKKKKSVEFITAQKAIRRSQPIHKRFALQPITVLVLMCVGVLLCAFTLSAFADTVSVGAIVPAPPLTEAATMTSPTSGITTGTQAMIVSGVCPDNSYINLTNNGSFSGEVMCSSGAFQISLDLTLGTNQLQVQDYNITNSPGPQSGVIVVTYVPGSTQNNSGGSTSTPSNTSSAQPPVTPYTTPAVESPVATPVRLMVTQVDLTIPYISPSLTPIVSYQPTVTGIAPPYSYISVTIHSSPHTCTTYANAQGYWGCTMSSELAPGLHTVYVTATTPQGVKLTITPFTIRVISAAPPQLGIPEPFRITTSYSYTIENVGQQVSYTIHVSGGRAPYAFTVDWGDGKTSTIIQQTSNDFTISHAYGWVNATLASKIVKVQAIDASGQSSTLQLDSLIRNPAFHSVIANVTKSSGLWGLFGDLRPWLWVIWPGYFIVMLLVFSFWLGEREELAIILSKKNRQSNRGKHVHAHARR